MAIEFAIEAEVARYARAGRLTSAGSDGVNRVVETPQPLLVTRRGAMPFLPAQMVENGLSGAHAHCRSSQIPILDFLYLNGNSSTAGAALIAENFDRGVRQFVNSKTDLLVLSSRAAGDDDFVGVDGSSGKNFVLGESRADSRRLKMTAGLMIEMQKALRCDLAEVPSIPCKAGMSTKHILRAVDRSITILDETIAASLGTQIQLLGGVQGGTDEAALRRSAAALKRRIASLSGFVISSLHVGESWEDRKAILGIVGEELRETRKLCVASGNGSPEDVLLCVAHGVDLVESSYPFDLAEVGLASDLRSGRSISLRDAALELDKSPISKECPCQTCKRHTKAYLHHLLNVHEMMGQSLLALHNLQDYLDFFQRIQESIRTDTFGRFCEAFDASRVPRYLA